VLPKADTRKGDRSATKVRAIRISDEVWHAALARAADRGETVAEVVRAALVAYVGLRHTTGLIGRSDRHR